jgi:hypothetical protein
MSLQGVWPLFGFKLTGGLIPTSKGRVIVPHY